MYTETVSCS